MGSEIQLIFSKGRAAKIKPFLKDGYTSPDNRTSCWLDWKNNRLEIGHASNVYSRGWADAIALSIAMKFPVKEVCYPSFGYVSAEEFLKTLPFAEEIRLHVTYAIPGIGKYKKKQKEYLKAAKAKIG